MKKSIFVVCMAFLSIVVFAQNAQTSLQNGIQQFEQNNYDAAIQELTEAIRLDPNMAEAYAYRARSYNGINPPNRNQALADANSAIRLNPRLAMGYYARGRTYRYMNDNDRAIADYTESIRLDPNFATAYYNRGNAYLDKNDYDRAIADYTQSIRLDPNDADAYYNRGYAYGNKNDYDRAIADYTEAIRLNPNYSSAYNNRGNAYLAKRDYDRAIADFNQALRLNPNNTYARDNLALAQNARTRQQQQAQPNTLTQNGVRVTNVNTGMSNRASFVLENTTSQTKRVIIVIRMTNDILNSPEYTLTPNERREVVMPLPKNARFVKDEPWVFYAETTARFREIIVY